MCVCVVVLCCVQVRQALACGNVMRFFRLYPTAPWLSRRLMDAGVKQLRYKLLCAMVRSHRPTAIGLPFLTRSLGFVEPEEQQQQQQLGGVTVDSSGRLLPGCSVERCVGDTEPCVDEQQGMAACLEWCKRHGAVFDQERGEQVVLCVAWTCEEGIVWQQQCRHKAISWI